MPETKGNIFPARPDFSWLVQKVFLVFQLDIMSCLFIIIFFALAKIDYEKKVKVIFEPNGDMFIY